MKTNYFILHDIYCMEGLKKHYERHVENRGANFFFTPDSMRFFNCRLGQNIYPGPKCIYFVTSEKYDYKSKRFYTIRKYDPKTGDIGKVSEFQEYASGSTANRIAKKLASEE